MKPTSVLVFCGSATGNDDVIKQEVLALGKLLAEKKIRLIYGGGNIGLMGMIADEVLKNGGEVVGVIPGFLMDKEVGHTELTELHVVDSMHVRKAKMCDIADMVIALPGGYGTLDELFEMLTWLQLGLHQKPIGVLNVNGFYDFILKQLDVMVEKNFLKQDNRDLICAESSAVILLEKLESMEIKQGDKWFRERNLS